MRLHVCLIHDLTSSVIGQMVVAHIEQDVRCIIRGFPIDFSFEIRFWNYINRFIVAVVPKTVCQVEIFFDVDLLKFQLTAIITFALILPMLLLLLLFVIAEGSHVCHVMTASWCRTQMNNNTVQTVFMIDAFVAVSIFRTRCTKATQFQWRRCDRMFFVQLIVESAQLKNQNPWQLWIRFQLYRFLTMLASVTLDFIQMFPG